MQQRHLVESTMPHRVVGKNGDIQECEILKASELFCTIWNVYVPTRKYTFRILEFELDNVYVGSKNVKSEVELWDVSGDHK